MVNSKFLILVVTWLLISSFTYATNNLNDNRKIIYCPETIECYKSNSSVSSCRAVGGDLMYWRSIPTPTGWPIGTYHINKVKAAYQNATPTTIYCMYKTHTPFPDQAQINTKVGANFEALYENWTGWKVNGGLAECETNLASSCPLIEKAELLVSHTLRDKKNLEYYDTRERINIKLASDDGTNILDSSLEYFVINYEKAVAVCGFVKQCHINIKLTDARLSTPYYVGSVWVNLEENMRIISITPLNNNSPYVMGIVSPFGNTVIFYKK